MNTVLDSSAWIEYFTNGKSADIFADLIESGSFVVPSIELYEVYRRFLTLYDETQAIRAISHMQKGQVVDLTEYLAVWAAKLSKDLKLPMADSIILATAYSTNSIVWTLDADFKGVDGVNYFPKEV